MGYDFARIEKKWQNYWLENKTYKAVTGDRTKKKFFPLVEFPYPSGEGCMSVIPGRTPRWTSWRASAAWRARTSSSR